VQTSKYHIKSYLKTHQIIIPIRVYIFYVIIYSRKSYSANGPDYSAMKGVDYVLSIVALTVISIVVILLISLIFKDIGKKILLPLAVILISIVLFFISFIVGGWEGMGLSAISLSLFLASIIAFIAIVLFYKITSETLR